MGQPITCLSVGDFPLPSFRAGLIGAFPGSLPWAESVPGAAGSCTICTGGRAVGEKHLKSTATSVLSSLVHHNMLTWRFTLFGSVTAVGGVARYLEMR